MICRPAPTIWDLTITKLTLLNLELCDCCEFRLISDLHAWVELNDGRLGTQVSRRSI